jgi:hypothetical protein
MSGYRRAGIEGGTFFFTATLADPSSDLSVRHLDGLRRIDASVRQRSFFRVSTSMENHMPHAACRTGFALKSDVRPTSTLNPSYG